MSTIDPGQAEAVLSRIEEDELVELALRLANIESPRGSEGECGEAIYQWSVESGFRTRRVGLTPDRFNVFAELPGATLLQGARIQRAHRHVDDA